MRKGRFFAVVTACVAVLLAAGCGGGGDGGVEEVTASSLTKADYVKQASVICEQSAKRIKVDFGVYTREHEGENASETARLTGLIHAVFTPNVEREIDELRELGAPEGDVKTVEAMLKAREGALAAIEKDPKSALTNKPFEKSIKAAKDYGVAACAVP